MDDHRIHLSSGTEDRKWRTPWESLFFAYAATVPMVAGAVAFWLAPGASLVIVHVTLAWTGAVLCFLAGVRRGLSFRQEDGPLLTQLGAMLWLFGLGFVSLIAPALVAVVLQILGYVTLAVSDLAAARRGEAPRYFARLRPVQMMIPIGSLVLILVGLLH